MVNKKNLSLTLLLSVVGASVFAKSKEISVRQEVLANEKSIVINYSNFSSYSIHIMVYEGVDTSSGLMGNLIKNVVLPPPKETGQPSALTLDNLLPGDKIQIHSSMESSWQDKVLIPNCSPAQLSFQVYSYYIVNNPTFAQAIGETPTSAEVMCSSAIIEDDMDH